MRYAPVTDRLAGLGGAKWEIHFRARKLKSQGRRVIELTIGEPDVATPDTLIAAAAASMQSGRTGYSNGRGEPGTLAALAEASAASCCSSHCASASALAAMASSGSKIAVVRAPSISASPT